MSTVPRSAQSLVPDGATDTYATCPGQASDGHRKLGPASVALVRNWTSPEIGRPARPASGCSNDVWPAAAQRSTTLPVFADPGAVAPR